MWIRGISCFLTVRGEERLDIIADEDASMCRRERAVIDRLVLDGFDEGLSVSSGAKSMKGTPGICAGLVRGRFSEGGKGAGGDVGEESGYLRK